MSTIACHSPLNISETIRDRDLVPKDHQYEMAYGESNGHVTDNVTWPWKVKLVTPMYGRLKNQTTLNTILKKNRHRVPKNTE